MINLFENDMWAEEAELIATPVKTTKPKVRVCNSCKGTGEYVNAKYRRVCKSCLGKGYLDADRIQHQHRYLTMCKNPAMKHSHFSDYNHKEDWGYMSVEDWSNAF